LLQELNPLVPNPTSQIDKSKQKLLNYLIAFESILILLLTVVAIQVRQIGEDLSPNLNIKVFLLILAFPIMWLCVLSLFGAWDVTILDNHFDGYLRLLKASWITFLTFSSASYIFKIQISRFVILFSLIGGTILHLILRWVFLRISDNRKKYINEDNSCIFITSNGQANNAAEKFAEIYDLKPEYFEGYYSQKDFNIWLNNLKNFIESNTITKLALISVEGLSNSQLDELIWLSQKSNLEFLVYDQLGTVTSQNIFKRFPESNWLSIQTSRINDSQRLLKRFFDLALVIPSLLILSPLYLAIALAIMINSRGGVFYTQKRIGRDGKLFTFPKFRTMKPGSDEIRLEILGRPDENMTERYRNDPRITKVGKVLRRFSLDELPQLWCVLIGTMSLVGPRPILPEEEVQLSEFHFKRNIAKPGLTGIWQVSGRKDTTWEERMAFDIKYIQSWSLGLDLVLIARTFKSIVSGSGSY
jgi:exopolysaccharide biosynthesis polyprenyl glycosylphosphotransferase